MKVRLGVIFGIFVSLAFACCAEQALAVIKVDLPVSKRFETAKTVVIGKVSAVDIEHRVVEVTTTERLKDDAAPDKFRLQFSPAITMISAIAVDQPVVFLSTVKASIHVADTWLVATPKPGASTPIWSVSLVDTNSAGKTFPGTTASLARALQELKTGKSTLLDSFETKLFTGDVKEIAKLDVIKPTALLSIDLNGDKKPDLIVATPAGVKVLLAAGDGFEDATEKLGLKGATATCVAAGDVNGDGKIDLLLDGVLYLRDGQKFAAVPQAIKLDADAHMLACALADFTGGGKLDAGFYLTDGRLVVFKNDGQTSSPWKKTIDRKLPVGADPVQSAVFGDFSDQGPGVMVVQEKSIAFHPARSEGVSDFSRLTGDGLPKIKGFAAGMKNAIATPIDVKGDSRPDLLITADGASMILINRGFGTFLPDSDAGAVLNAAVSKVLPASFSGIHARAAMSRGAGAPDDLLLLSDDGHLFLAANAAAAK